MASSAAFQIRGRVDGLAQGVENIYLPFTLSTSAGGLSRQIVISTGTSVATSVACSTLTKMILVIPPATNTVPYRVVGTTGDLGVQFSSLLPALLPVTTASVIGLYTTGGSTVGGFTVIEY